LVDKKKREEKIDTLLDNERGEGGGM